MTITLDEKSSERIILPIVKSSEGPGKASNPKESMMRDAVIAFVVVTGILAATQQATAQ